MSPAQRHFITALIQSLRKHGTWLAIDRMAGSLLNTDERPTQYGVPLAERNHRFNIGYWFGPLLTHWGPSAMILCFIFPAAPMPMTMMVVLSQNSLKLSPVKMVLLLSIQVKRGFWRLVRYRLDEDELSTFEYDDVMRA